MSNKNLYLQQPSQPPTSNGPYVITASELLYTPTAYGPYIPVTRTVNNSRTISIRNGAGFPVKIGFSQSATNTTVLIDYLAPGKGLLYHFDMLVDTLTFYPVGQQASNIVGQGWLTSIDDAGSIQDASGELYIFASSADITTDALPDLQSGYLLPFSFVTTTLGSGDVYMPQNQITPPVFGASINIGGMHNVRIQVWGNGTAPGATAELLLQLGYLGDYRTIIGGPPAYALYDTKTVVAGTALALIFDIQLPEPENMSGLYVIYAAGITNFTPVFSIISGTARVYSVNPV